MWSLIPLAVVAVHGVARLVVAWRALSTRARRWLALVPAAGQLMVALQPSLSLRRRAAALLAGSLAAYLAVVVLVIAAATTAGLPGQRRAYVVDHVAPGSPADGAIMPGDRLVAMDQQPVFQEPGAGTSPAEIVAKAEGRAIDVEYERGGVAGNARLTPRFDERERTYRLGIGLTLTSGERVAMGEAVAMAVRFPLERILLTARAYRELFGGQEQTVFMGPVGITEMVRGMDRQRALEDALHSASLLLAALAALDLLFLAAAAAAARRGAAGTRPEPCGPLSR